MQNYFYRNRAFQPSASVPVAVSTPPRRKLSRRVVVLFFCALALIAGLTVAILLLGNWEAELPMAGRDTAPPEASDEPGMPDSAQATTVERAPLGDGTTLTIAPLPEGETLSFQQIYRDNVASVVSIQGEQAQGISLGTGVVMSQDGYIITNAHIVERCSRVTVVLSDEREWNALLVGMDEETDLAVLKIAANGLTPAEFGDSELVQVGDEVLAIGNPLGVNLRGTMTDGIISAINRDVLVDGYTMNLIQTTAALNSGNSGGALINAYGQVIGITNLKMQSYYSTVEGLGFAIPSATVKKVVDKLIAQGYVDGRPVIGITVSTLTEALAEEYGAPVGVRVEEVKEGSDAKRKGVRVGDVIVEADGIPVAAKGDLLAVKNARSAGDSIRLRLWRDGAYLTVDVELVEQYQLE